jgi:two-component system, OmpR family, response regulator
VVLDLSLPDGEGTELVPEIRERHPRTRVVVLSAREDVGEVASEAGADAAIPKETPLPDIISTLRRLADSGYRYQASDFRKEGRLPGRA